jgi:hypothetical protein
MATSERNDQVEIPASQGQQKRLSISEILGTFCLKFCLLYFNWELDLDLLSSLVNVSPPKDRTTSNSEQPLKVPTEIVNDNTQLQGTAFSQHEGPSDATTQHTSHHHPPKNPIIPYPETMPNVQGTEETTSERSLTQLESSAVSFSEHDLPHELVLLHGSVSTQEDTAPLEITGEPHDILSSAAPADTREQSSRKGSLKGKTWFRFAFPPVLTLRIRYFPWMFIASPLQWWADAGHHAEW